MSFTYNLNIPNPPNPPSVDVPNMQTNTNSINNWVQVDHVGFAGTTSGQHNHVTFPVVQTGTSSPFANTYPISQIFPQTFGNVATTEELYYADSSTGGGPRASINRLIPTVKGYAMVNWNGVAWTLLGSATNNLQVNIASISAAASTGFTVNFTTSLDYSTYSVFTAISGNLSTVYRINSTAVSNFVFVIAGVGGASNVTVTFMVV